jgi:hypothetical protein
MASLPGDSNGNAYYHEYVRPQVKNLPREIAKHDRLNASESITE